MNKFVQHIVDKIKTLEIKHSKLYNHELVKQYCAEHDITVEQLVKNEVYHQADREVKTIHKHFKNNVNEQGLLKSIRTKNPFLFLYYLDQVDVNKVIDYEPERIAGVRVSVEHRPVFLINETIFELMSAPKQFNKKNSQNEPIMFMFELILKQTDELDHKLKQDARFERSMLSYMILCIAMNPDFWMDTMIKPLIDRGVNPYVHPIIGYVDVEIDVHKQMRKYYDVVAVKHQLDRAIPETAVTKPKINKI